MMKISEVIAVLEATMDMCGDIEVQLQNSPDPGDYVVSDERVFVVAEKYEDGVRVNIRSWPY